MRVSKIYLYKRQIKKRNSFICFFFFVFSKLSFSFFFELFFLLFLVRLRLRCIFFFWKIFKFKNLFVKSLEIVIMSSRWYFIKISVFESFTSTISNIIVSEFFFFFKNFFLIIFFIFTFSAGFSPTLIIFSFLFHSSAAASLYWVIKLFQNFIFSSSSNVFENVNFFEKIVLLTTESDDWCRNFIFINDD